MKYYPPLKAEELKKEVCRIIEALGFSYETEKDSQHGSSIIGKGRRIDVVIINPYTNDILMHIECKAQSSQGTTEDKLFKAVEEANRDKKLGTSSIIVYSGFGWSVPDMRHALLNGSVRIEVFEDWLKLFMKYEKLNPSSIQD